MMKGAPERVMDRCSHALINNEDVPITPELRQQFEDINALLAKRGERVLAFAQFILPRDKFPSDFKVFFLKIFF
jgi:magnesium-transporting ATPase (P-type)